MFKERLLTGWNGARWLRLVFALVFLAAGLKDHEPMAYIAAVFFGVQAVFNVGCCGIGACAPARSSTKADPGNITYERLD
ncbi:MAG: hypothetical protein IPJ76_00290 [Flavobacteriales bacterium]|nr:MAG: hypothetical protein IPJ76_00290 [Flavobacteriales bacterium]